MLLKHFLDLISILMSIFCKFVTIWFFFVNFKKFSVRSGLEFSKTWILTVFIFFTPGAYISVVLWICQNSWKLGLKLFNSSLCKVHGTLVRIVFIRIILYFVGFSLFDIVALVIWRLSLYFLHFILRNFLTFECYETFYKLIKNLK